VTQPASFRAHLAVPFMNPMSEADVDGAIAGLAVPSAGARVVETGCGGAELLLRILACHDQATGVGVDPDALARGRPRAAAAARVPGREPQLVEAPAQEAGLEPGAFDLVVNVAASHAHGGFPGALRELAALARPGGLVLFGEGFWTRPPSAEVLEALGGASADELPLGLDGLLAAVRAAGLEPVDVRAASVADWATYEEGLATEAERHDDEDALDYARRIRDRRALPDGTTTLGFALLTLQR
jgi:SAM-dependent methyltransferase